jgi:hypothetical protein
LFVAVSEEIARRRSSPDGRGREERQRFVVAKEGDAALL